jgi:DNA repair protein RadA/Sms
VLSFDEERSSEIRILRCLKNRFGPTTEVGIFRMGPEGLESVDDPTEFLLRGPEGDVGSCLACPMIRPGAGAGTRPCLIDVEVLIHPCTESKPRRIITGWPYEPRRLEMMLTLLELSTDLYDELGEDEEEDDEEDIGFGGHDIFLNISTPYTIEDKSLDLPVCLALASALRCKPLPAGTVAWGEVGLVGAVVKPEGAFEARRKICEAFGFNQIVASPIDEPIDLAEAVKLPKRIP